MKTPRWYGNETDSQLNESVKVPKRLIVYHREFVSMEKSVRGWGTINETEEDM